MYFGQRYILSRLILCNDSHFQSATIYGGISLHYDGMWPTSLHWVDMVDMSATFFTYKINHFYGTQKTSKSIVHCLIVMRNPHINQQLHHNKMTHHVTLMLLPTLMTMIRKIVNKGKSKKTWRTFKKEAISGRNFDSPSLI